MRLRARSRLAGGVHQTNGDGDVGSPFGHGYHGWVWCVMNAFALGVQHPVAGLWNFEPLNRTRGRRGDDGETEAAHRSGRRTGARGRIQQPYRENAMVRELHVSETDFARTLG